MSVGFRSSVSQVATYELCPRKWAFEKIDGLERPSNAAADLGTAVHDLKEAWLKEGKVPDMSTRAGKIAAVMIPHVPPPQAVNPNNVEIEMNLKLGGIHFMGYLDLWMPEVKKIPWVYDHKTTSDFCWALTPDRAHEDIQATLYAAWGMLKTGSKKAGIQWTYGLTKGKAKHRVCRQILTAEMISPRLRKTVESAKQMQILKESGLTAMQIPYNAGGCDAYGGCAFKSRCNLTPEESLESLMTQESVKQSFVEKLRAFNAARAAGEIPADAKFVDDAMPSTTKKKTKKKEDPEEEVEETPTPAKKKTTTKKKASKKPAEDYFDDGDEVEEETPPPRTTKKKASKKPATPADDFDDEDEEEEEEPAPAKKKASKKPATPADDFDDEDEEEEEEPAPAKKKASKKPAAPADDFDDEDEEEEEPAPAQLKTRPSKTEPWILYVDCFPIKGSTAEHAANMLQLVAARVCKEHKVPHYKTIEYGKGPGLFAAAVLAEVRANPPENGLLVTTGSMEVQDCLQGLMAEATFVVRG